MNWRGLTRAVLWTQLVAQAVGVAKLEGALRLSWWIEDPWTTRCAVFALGAVLTLVFAPLNAWLSWRLQR